MTVKELKALLNECDDSQVIVLKSESGIEWEMTTLALEQAKDKYNKKPKMFVEVK